MSPQLLVEPEAEEELGEAIAWYEEQRQGLGDQLFDAVTRSIAAILRFPRSGALVPYVPDDLPVRRMAVPGFPYQIIYIVIPDAIRVLAVAHDRRRPGYWLSRSPS